MYRLAEIRKPVALLLMVSVLLSPCIHSFACAEEVRILIYIIGGDLETQTGSATEDLKEMMRNTFPDDVCVFVCLGGADRWHLPSIGQRTSVFCIREDRMDPETTLDGCISDENTLERFLQLYGTTDGDNWLVFWGHGTDAPPGIGVDETNNGAVLPLVAIHVVLSRVGLPITVLGFDTCGTGTLQNAWLFRDDAEWFVAATGSESLEGWHYGSWMANVHDIATALAELKHDFGIRSSRQTVGSLSLSVVSLVRMKEISQVLAPLVNETPPDVSSVLDYADFTTDSDIAQALIDVFSDNDLLLN